jgi:hypothetical protein
MSNQADRTRVSFPNPETNLVRIKGSWIPHQTCLEGVEPEAARPRERGDGPFSITPPPFQGRAFHSSNLHDLRPPSPDRRHRYGCPPHRKDVRRELDAVVVAR